MKFFIDTADIAEIKALAATGLLDGVTTNPTLIAKSGRRILEVIAEICAVVPGPVSAEVAATEYDQMMREAEVLRHIASNVAIKVPLTPDGLREDYIIYKRNRFIMTEERVLAAIDAEGLIPSRQGLADYYQAQPARDAIAPAVATTAIRV